MVETAQMLNLDALEYAPNLWVVLTAREHLTRRDTYRHLEQLRRLLRRRWPVVEWFVQVEFQKRGALHLNLLIKGVPTDDAERLLGLICGHWCARVDAEPQGQHIEAVGSAQAVTRYLQKELSHGLKREQAPPLGWKGHRTSQTRGYFSVPASVMRSRAREALRVDRALWRARNAGATAEEAEAIAAIELEQAAAAVWTLATDRGARIAGTAYDPRRLALGKHEELGPPGSREGVNT